MKIGIWISLIAAQIGAPIGAGGGGGGGLPEGGPLYQIILSP